jgi:hypothetical protein
MTEAVVFDLAGVLVALIQEDCEDLSRPLRGLERLSRHPIANSSPIKRAADLRFFSERATGLEPATLTLAR